MNLWSRSGAAPGEGDGPAGPIEVDGRPVVVRRSARRKRTVTAFWEEGTAVVAIPASFTRRQEREWVPKMLERLQQRSQRAQGGDDELMHRAAGLSRRYLQGRAVPSSVRWVTNQRKRWGSASPADRSIRLSAQLRDMPDWVVDYVLLHELAHLLVAGHGRQFWALLEGYPRLAEAKAFLAGVSHAADRGLDLPPYGFGAEDSGAAESENL